MELDVKESMYFDYAEMGRTENCVPRIKKEGKMYRESLPDTQG